MIITILNCNRLKILFEYNEQFIIDIHETGLKQIHIYDKENIIFIKSLLMLLVYYNIIENNFIELFKFDGYDKYIILDYDLKDIHNEILNCKKNCIN